MTKTGIDFKLPRNIKRIKKGDKILLFNPTVPSWLVTNKNGELILSFCNGKRSFNEIVELFCTKYGKEHKEIVKKFLLEANNSRIFQISEDSNKVYSTNYKLNILQISLTSKCNLNCIYCYASARSEKGIRSLLLEDYKKLIKDALEISSGLSVVLTGGEPLLNTDCFSIAEYAKQNGCQVHLLSNGTLINNKNIQLIKANFDLVVLSIDGSTKQIHEKHRGENSYDKVINAVKLLDINGVDYTISMTVDKLNIHDVGEMAKKYGSRLRYAPLFNAGNAKKNNRSISGIEYYRSLANVKGVNPLSYCESSLDSASECKNHKCAIGDAELSISETGDVYPCQLLHNKEFHAGNIFKESLSEIYHSSPVLQSCRHLTVDNLDGCSKCFLRYVCGGACRARAYYECGKINNSGKFCEYEKAAFVNGIFELYSENAL